MNMADQNTVKIPGHRLGIALALGGFLFSVMVTKPIAGASLRQGEPTRRSLTPLQLEIEKQEQRLRSTDVEERRDAVMRLGAIRRPEASRAAASALHDASPIVRATASAAVLWLPGEERATALIPLLKDKDEFVRQESAYALGPTRSKSAVAPLIERLLEDKKDGVRGAAAVALGQIAEDAATISLAQVLHPQSSSIASKKDRKRKSKENDLVLRAAAHSLGQIGSRAGVPALLSVLQDENSVDDVRREAADALGLIGDPSAVVALRRVLGAQDPYLARAAEEALRKISEH